MDTIELFMWGYQRHFQILIQSSATQVFDLLDPKLKPQVFLVGILVEEREDRFPICLEPEDCGYKVEDFTRLKEVAGHLWAVDEERAIFHSHPIAQEQHEVWLWKKSLKDAVQRALDHPRHRKDSNFLVSMPVCLEGYAVSVVLKIDRAASDKHYRLLKGQVEGRYPISTSLLDATITEFLGACERALSGPDPGSDPDVLRRAPDEIIRLAGRRLTYTPAWSGGGILGLHGLFDACNVISSLRYEGAEGIGKMLVSRRGHPNLEEILSLSTPVSIRDHRAVRKLLEVSAGDLCLLSDSAYIYGLGRLCGAYDPRAEDLFLFSFVKHYTWELSHDSRPLMQVCYGQPRLPMQEIDKEKFTTDLRRIFRDITSGEVEKLWMLVLEAICQKHGTMVVVSPEAASEASRLQKQCIRVEPVQLTPELMRMVTAIDGAVLIAQDGVCYAIGVILDGLASDKGDPSRGARYNSAIRYIESRMIPCLAIVISQDGSINLVPNLKPQVRRTSLLEAVARLQTLSDSEKIDIRQFNLLMGWLREHEFYLSGEMCDEINSIRRAIDSRIDMEWKSGIVRLVHEDLTPSTELDESYFMDE
jgi:hypothetical protein